jgi:hypothetical protein
LLADGARSVCEAQKEEHKEKSDTGDGKVEGEDPSSTTLLDNDTRDHGLKRGPESYSSKQDGKAKSTFPWGRNVTDNGIQ